MKEIVVDSDKPREECGLFGIFGNEEAATLTYLGLYGLQHRGQESCGIVASDGKAMRKQIGMGKVVDFFSEDILKTLEGDRAIGHVRYSTTGKSAIINAQPIMIGSSKGTIAMAHNGNLTNARQLREELEDEGSIFQSTNDSEVIVHLIAKSKKDSFVESVIDALSQVQGAYCLVFMKKDTIMAVRDPHGLRPLSLGKLGSSKVIASESCAFSIIDAEFTRDIEPGEMLIITKNKTYSIFPFKDKQAKRAHCIFELIYFASPASKVFGESVYNFRFELGRQLAREDNIEADIVIPVPDSGRMAALGYGSEMNLKVKEGLIRSHYTGRTFIEPSQKIRDFGAKIKFFPVREVLEGKRVVVVDDSIIRGTTSRKIIKMIRQAGAKEVHLRIGAPPTRFPCFYGIDFPNRKELVANGLSVKEISYFLEVDSLGYISYEGLFKCIKGNTDNFCAACFSGEYPTAIDEDFFKEQLEVKEKDLKLFPII